MTMSDVSNVTRREVWGLLYDLERNVRYYRNLSDRYRIWYRCIRYFLLIGVVLQGLVLYLFAMLQPTAGWIAGGILALMLTSLTVFDSVANYAEASAELRLAAISCDELGTLASRLWLDIESYSVSEHDAKERLIRIMNQWASVIQRVTVEDHNRDNVQAANEAAEVISARYKL